MSEKNVHVDAYIERAAPFARPILEKIRKAFDDAGPDIVETMKWSVHHFDYKGVLSGMAAFKQHVNWGFWKAGLRKGLEGRFPASAEASMGTMRLTEVSELPSHEMMVEFIHEAMRLNHAGVKTKRPARKATAQKLEVPEELAGALKKNRKARETFEAFPPSQKREYVAWIVDARQEATRQKRLATAIEWLSEGKPRNWKYMKEWSQPIP